MSVQLESSDGEVVTVPAEVAKMSVTIAHMLEDVDVISDDPDDLGSPIPLPNINSATLAKVLEYCSWHHANPNPSGDQKGADGVLEWDRKFCEVEQVVLYRLILAANYLDIKPLLELACRTVGLMIRACTTAEEIRQKFGIKADLTPEEEEEIKKEYAFLNDL
ncbi:SCF ubiquitin ligase complex protein SKP1a, putative [Acanthamoeba castellanii str. Neff]|uniref:SCF ubiquitin ligase complex protein SKP1a, putative n=1 Tax=Acanthamoeba castellanii (strain ATCC 30010 / Neff) TaxID=1257118 RepID=L8HJ88_ACACF|nr:SCF ubiquitin ligase complex protein SKP1a, putative [Acanthamoeba castellanii str. Neff]ELR25255.1 SCF ubiquitin ligase complex protein SKP1a, putative [Acanthamoeba castellanii str. Neff]